MKLHSIHTGLFKLDGGAMFGVVPKSIWQRTNPADENNMCTWALRCLLIEDGDRLILIDNGTGDKQSEKFFSHYYMHGNDTLQGSLRQAGFAPSDVTDVFLTHLHFDHCGGGVQWADRSKGTAELVFQTPGTGPTGTIGHGLPTPIRANAPAFYGKTCGLWRKADSCTSFPRTRRVHLHNLIFFMLMDILKK